MTFSLVIIQIQDGAIPGLMDIVSSEGFSAEAKEEAEGILQELSFRKPDSRLSFNLSSQKNSKINKGLIPFSDDKNVCSYIEAFCSLSQHIGLRYFSRVLLCACVLLLLGGGFYVCAPLEMLF